MCCADGECWLRRLDPAQLHANSSFRQRGKYTDQWLRQHRGSRAGCKRNEPWACSPTHVPYTSGALGGTPFNPSESYVTGGGWGKVYIRSEAEYLSFGAPAPAVSSSSSSRRRSIRRLTRRRAAS